MAFDPDRDPYMLSIQRQAMYSVRRYLRTHHRDRQFIVSDLKGAGYSNARTGYLFRATIAGERGLWGFYVRFQGGQVVTGDESFALSDPDCFDQLNAPLERWLQWRDRSRPTEKPHPGTKAKTRR